MPIKFCPNHPLSACIYLRGSRAIGAPRPDSDWDFFIILSGPHNSKLQDVLLKCGNVDVALYGVEAFTYMLTTHVVYAIDGIIQRPWTFPNSIDFWEVFMHAHRTIAPSVWQRDLMQSVGFEYRCAH